MWDNASAPSSSPPLVDPRTAVATCTDCGGPLEPDRYARCLACVSTLWVALEERYGREWAARHRGQS